MKWYFLTQVENRERMQARVLQILDHLLLPIDSFSMARLDDQLFFSFVVEADETRARRAESLLRKIHCARAVTVLAETTTMPRMHALFRLRCDISDRDEVLHFISALDARLLMIRPLWVVFEVVGTPSEVEGIYQSILGYGLVDQTSSSCSFVTSGVVQAKGNVEASAEEDWIAEPTELVG